MYNKPAITKSDPEVNYSHVLYMYEAWEDRLKVLVEYFGEGLAKHELCILVTPVPQKTVVKDFLAAGLDIRKSVRQNDLRIFEMTEAYLPHGEFVANYMLMNVVNYIIDAKSRGYNGIRTAGDMAWLCDHPESLSDADRYEQQVNKLNIISPEFTGLCLYPVQQGVGQIVDSALRTHPSFIYDGKTRTNPFSNSSASPVLTR